LVGKSRNKEKEKEYKRLYYQRNRDKIKLQQKIRYESDKESWKLAERKRRLRKSYFPDLTPEEAYQEYTRMHAAQEGLCAICKRPESKIDPQLGSPTMLAVDHNSKTKKVRALLCFRCNTNLGWYEKMESQFEEYLKIYDTESA